ncbi:MAG TPA: biotin synthase, partial [Thermococcus sp.]|nr:biotin synthase [Thermococcus sp.]
ASVVEEMPVTYEISEFMRNYYNALTKLSSPSTKVEYSITLGISQYIYFGGDKALRAILFTRSMLPFEDWTSIYFVNRDILDKQQIAVLRELASKSIKIKKEGDLHKLEMEE